MASEYKDILDFNVTLGSLRSLLDVIFNEEHIDVDFLRRKVAINKFDLISDSLGFLKKLRIIDLERGFIVPKITYGELNLIRAVILNSLMKSEDQYVHYLSSFIDQFLSSKKYYEKRDVWKMLTTVRSKEGVGSSQEELRFKLNQLVRLLMEIGLAVKFRKILIPIIDPSLIIEILTRMKKTSGSIHEITNNIGTDYLPCCDVHGKPYDCFSRALESLEKMGFVKLGYRSDAGMDVIIGGKRCNFMEVLS
ncbi:MAG: hypothetical protein QXO15_12155 [Nitrososphaerota archaeon]